MEFFFLVFFFINCVKMMLNRVETCLVTWAIFGDFFRILNQLFVIVELN